jgi:hypothetical protein
VSISKDIPLCTHVIRGTTNIMTHLPTSLGMQNRPDCVSRQKVAILNACCEHILILCEVKIISLFDITVIIISLFDITVVSKMMCSTSKGDTLHGSAEC